MRGTLDVRVCFGENELRVGSTLRGRFIDCDGSNETAGLTSTSTPGYCAFFIMSTVRLAVPFSSPARPKDSSGAKSVTGGELMRYASREEGFVGRLGRAKLGV